MFKPYKAALGLLLALSLGAFAVQAQTVAVHREGDVPVGKDVAIHFVEAGDRQAKTTLLFVPGWGMSTAVWRDQITAFSASARVVSIDPRSQGFSTISMHSNTPEQRAQDLREVIRALALTNVVLVGWSQGVQDVAAYAAAFGGEGIAGYVLVDSVVGAGPAAAVANQAGLKQELERLALYQRYPRDYLRGMMNAIIASPGGKARIDELVELSLRTPPDIGITMLIMDFIAIDRRPALPKFDRPTLVIASAESGELAEMRAMAAQIRDARIETIAQAGHAVFLDQPARFHELLADFVRRVQG
ncbi:MAG: alpha/beta hydrolase [Ramlibacter sp.]